MRSRVSLLTTSVSPSVDFAEIVKSTGTLRLYSHRRRKTNKIPVTIAMYHGCTIDHDLHISQLVPDQHELHMQSPVTGLQRLPTPHGQKLAHSGPHLFP